MHNRNLRTHYNGLEDASDVIINTVLPAGAVLSTRLCQAVGLRPNPAVFGSKHSGKRGLKPQVRNMSPNHRLVCPKIQNLGKNGIPGCF